MINIGEPLTLRVEKDCRQLTFRGMLLILGYAYNEEVKFYTKDNKYFNLVGTNGVPNYVIDIVLQEVKLLDSKDKTFSDVGLTMTEYIELKYFHALGFNYLVRDEIGYTVVFKDKPKLEEVDGGLRHWYASKSVDIELSPKVRRKTELASYEFVQFEDEPVNIKNLLKGYSIKKD